LFNLDWTADLPNATPILGFSGILLRPKCMGRVRIVSNIPLDQPQINHDYLCHPDDTTWAIQFFKDTLQVVQNLHKIDPAYSLAFPTAAQINDTATLKQMLPYLATPYRHPSGSMRMSPFNSVDKGVVDGNLCVHGIQGVRVVDASIFPVIPSGNLQSPVYAVAGLAAQMIQGGNSC